MRFVVIGGGARGLMRAGLCRKAGVETYIVEHSGRTGRKILITGKGRCNLTNDCDESEFLKNIASNPKFLYSAIHSFAPSDTMAFFENLGVKLKTERGRRVFPASDRARDIKSALEKHAKGARVIYADARQILFCDGRVTGVELDGGKILPADFAAVATGGLSYSYTGSTGDGYKFAMAAGHRVVKPTAGLVPLAEKGDTCRRMAGLSLKNIKLTMYCDGKKIYSEQGEMLFTHFGVSGPLVLTASSVMPDSARDVKLSIDLKPALSPEALYRRICRDFDALGAKKASNSLSKLLPASMIPVMLDLWGIDRNMNTNQIPSRDRRALAGLLKDFPVKIAGKYDIEAAVVTKGGVDVSEIVPATMESKIKKGLYFIGEVLDVDGYTGGYNLQIAFSTANACAEDVIKKCIGKG